MLSFLTPASIAASQSRLIRAVTGNGAEPDGGEDARARYFAALGQIQELGPGPVTAGKPWTLEADFSKPATGARAAHFRQVTGVTDFNEIPEADRRLIPGRIEAGHALLSEWSAEAAALPQSMVATFVIGTAKGVGAASLGDTLGVVWLSPPARWGALDFADALLHESVHQALYLEEMVSGVYAVPGDELDAPAALVTSAIRREKRPYDASFHAACVAVALIELHKSIGRREDAERMARGVEATLPELEERGELLTARGREILAEMRRGHESMDLA